MSRAKPKSMKTQIIAAAPPPKIGTSIAASFGHERFVYTARTYSQSNTVMGKNKTLKAGDTDLIWLNSTCLAALVARCLCHLP